MSRPHLASWSTLPAAGSTDWRHDAACTQEDPELFFPIGNSGPAVRQIDQAKYVCLSRCPVREQCLRYALDEGLTDGVWGGLSEDERKAYRRRVARVRSAGGSTNVAPPPAPIPRGDLVAATGVRAAFADAYGRGWSQSKIAVALNLDLRIVRQVLDGSQDWVTKGTVQKVTTGADTLAGPPPVRQRAQAEVSV